MLRPMTPADTGPVAELLRESYDPSLRRFISHAQSGVQAYLRAHLDEPALFPATEMTVATRDEDGAVIGFCEFVTDRSSSVSHLAYICISPEARNRGLGTALIHDHVERRRPPAVTLDVFEQNVAARRLYDRLGFTPVAERIWYTRPLPAAGHPADVVNGAEAVATHATYGFSYLSVAGRSGTRSIGRMGDTVLRCRTAEDFADDRFLAGVRACLPSATDALLIVPAEDAQPAVPGQVVVTRTARLQLPGDAT